MAKTKVILVRVREDLHKKLKVIAAKNSTTISGAIELLLKA